uniref:Putative secreted protein n=1 Tax=Anopheles darlingi TaxID=43151 RepID=A0A2M4DG00_ANODA
MQTMPIVLTVRYVGHLCVCFFFCCFLRPALLNVYVAPSTICAAHTETAAYAERERSKEGDCRFAFVCVLFHLRESVRMEVARAKSICNRCRAVPCRAVGSSIRGFALKVCAPLGAVTSSKPSEGKRELSA